MPLDKCIKKVLIIGSGPIVIGQAAEFDYAGTQACRVLKREGIRTVLVNSNPATIMTDRDMADAVYLEPLTAETVGRIIDIEKPDSILAGLGGQTGLNIAMELGSSGFLASRGVKVIGSDVTAISRAEDRRLFKQTLDEIGEPSIPSGTAESVADAERIAAEIGYPVIIRPAFTLGGSGGGVAYDPDGLKNVASVGIDASPIGQILVEKYIYGWKEIEFEAMRDAAGNSVAICSMENVDPVGIHTGDSIVVAPALTLGDAEYQMLRSASLRIVSALHIIGGCNCQFALDPHSNSYAVIEVNPRVSRSSALASKATGYPIAKMTALLALGYTLDELKNDVTGKTSACFEPAIDYVVVKFPKWPFDKFAGSDRTLGTQMKATGEVMAIGTSFEAAMLKAVRGAEIGASDLNLLAADGAPLAERLKRRDDRRIFTVFEALKSGISPEEINSVTGIDPFFLYKLLGMAEFEGRLAAGLPSPEVYAEAKRMGYTDRSIERICGAALPDGMHIAASYKTVDTCAAEFDAETPYFYSTSGEVCEAASAPRSGKPTVLVLGSGPIRIGQGIEFDYSSVRCVRTLKRLGYDAVIINNNPETVSTDYDTADRLYFEPLTPEDVMNVIGVEHPVGVVVAFGGQTAIKLTAFLDRAGIPILGTSAAGIDLAEDREKFDALLGRFGIRRPRGMSVTDTPAALAAANSLGYPVLLRPSYVIGGQNMQIVRSDEETVCYMERILSFGIDGAVLIDKYMPGTELEVDVISDGEDVLIPGIMQHIERAGVHSGDSIAVLPPFSLSDAMIETITDVSRRLALALGTKGLVNIQYLIYENELYVIEVNPRASRTVPYMSKVTGVPMADAASEVMLGTRLRSLGYGTGLRHMPPYVAVKVPVFSFGKLEDVNSRMGPEMKSTGEVLGIGRTFDEALFKGLRAAGYALRHPRRDEHVGVLFSSDGHDLPEIVSLAGKYAELGMELYATPDTAGAISALGIAVNVTPGMTQPDALFPLLRGGKISYIVYTGAIFDRTLDDYIALHREALRHGVVCFTSADTAEAFVSTLASGFDETNTEPVDINRMRRARTRIPFAKMEGCGNDYIFIDNRECIVPSPSALCVRLCDRAHGIGGCGIVLIEKVTPAGAAQGDDARMRVFNRDGSEGRMAGNSIRCVGKYLYDNGIIRRTDMKIETASGVKALKLYLRDGEVGSASVGMGRADFNPSSLPVRLEGADGEVIDSPLNVGGRDYRVTCCSVGNPHCVVFVDSVDGTDVPGTGPLFEHHAAFPDRVNTEFIRVVNPCYIRMRVWERANGETLACGTGACAAVAAAARLGLVRCDTDVTVRVRGGELTVRCGSDGALTLTGDARLVCTGEFEY